MRVREMGLAGLWLLGSASDGMTQQTRRPEKTSLQRADSRSCRHVDLEGVVHAHDSYRRSLGGGLDFLLEPLPHGWSIRVLPSSGVRPKVDYAELATPPFRSINPLLLTTDFGFRAQDVVGWNPRTFRYLARTADWKGADQAYRDVLSSRSPTAAAQEAAVTEVASRALEGRFEILDAALVPGTADQAAGAALVASHFATTAHTLQPSQTGAADALGTVLAMRFRVSLSVPDAGRCSGRTNPTQGR